MKKFQKKVPMTVALLSSFLLVLAGVAYIRYIELRGIHGTGTSLDELTRRFEERQYLITRLVKNNSDNRDDLVALLYSPTQTIFSEAEQKIHDDQNTLKQVLHEYKTFIADTTEQAKFDSLSKLNNLISQQVAHALELYSQGKVVEARTHDGNYIKPLFNNFHDITFRIADYVKERDFQHGDELIFKIMDTAALSKYMTYLLGLLFIILGTVIAFAISTIVRKGNLLQKSEKKYLDFIEESHDLISRTDKSGKVIFLNNKLKELLGYTDEELSQLSVYDVVESDFLTNMQEDFKNPEKIRAKRNISGTITSKSGKKIFFQGNVLWEYRGNLFDGAVAYLNDVTDQILLREELKVSEQSFRKLFNMAPVPMFTVDSTTMDFLQVNEAALLFYGFSREEFLAKNLMDIRPANDIPRTASAIAMIMEEGWNYKGVHTHIKKDGAITDVEIFSTRIDFGTSPFVLTTVVDLTERKLNENKISKAIIKTQEEERYEIGSELHDNVCQILATAKINMGLLRPFLHTDAEHIYSQTIEAIEMATYETRNLSHRLAPVFFENGTLKDSFERLMNTFNLENNYDLTINFDQAVLEYPLSLELQLNLYRILQEQMRNIVKHSQARKIILEVGIAKKLLHMYISDDGAGFDTDKVKNGIGLANMKRRSEFFSGKFNITSSPGKGCEVLVTIPLEVPKGKVITPEINTKNLIGEA